MRPLTPGSKVLILSGALKGQTKIVASTKLDGKIVYLKDALRTSMSKKLYNVKVDKSSLKILERNYKPPEKIEKKD